jgi:hypothetical protein
VLTPLKTAVRIAEPIEDIKAITATMIAIVSAVGIADLNPA